MKNDVKKRFIGEALEPVVETFDTSRMASGGPGLPREFIWRGEPVRIAKVRSERRETGSCRHGSGERYVSKHWFELETEDGHVLTVYFERRARGRALSARWWLFSVEEGDSPMTNTGNLPVSRGER
jgi:phosphoribosylglycinamide formyltransferase-1